MSGYARKIQFSRPDPCIMNHNYHKIKATLCNESSPAPPNAARHDSDDRSHRVSTRFKRIPIRNSGFMVGLMALLLAAAQACGTSVPTQTPQAFSSSPTPVQQELPTATPRAELTSPIDEPATEEQNLATPNLEATVQAMVSATVEAMQQQDPTPPATPSPNASENLTTEETGSPPQDTQTGSDGPAISVITQPGRAPGEATDDSETVPTSEQANTTGAGEAPENAGAPEPSVEPERRPEPLLPTVAPTPAATATPSPTATPIPEPTEPPPTGSRNNPVPLGQKGIVQDHRTHWEISVVDITPDAWDIIREENSFNKPPGEGKQFYLLRLRVKNVGEQRGFFVDYVKTTGRAVGWVYTTSGDSCGVFPGSNSREVFPGGEFELNVCWHIATADLPTLVMFWDEWPTPNPVWFDLR